MDSLGRGNKRAIVVANAQVGVDEGPVVGEVVHIVGVAVYAQGGVGRVKGVAAHGTAVVDKKRLVQAAREGLVAFDLDSAGQLGEARAR